MIKISHLQANNILHIANNFLAEIETSSIVRIKFRKLFAKLAEELQHVEKEAIAIKGCYANMSQEQIIELANSGNQEVIEINNKIFELYSIIQDYELDLSPETIDGLANQVTKWDYSLLFEVLL